MPLLIPHLFDHCNRAFSKPTKKFDQVPEGSDSRAAARQG
jgi:hypothetical protein